MYVITGATGNTGGQIAEALLDAGKSVRGIGRSRERLQPLRERGAEIAVGDLADTDFLTDAFRGATAVYAVNPSDYTAPDFRAHQNEVADALVRAVRDAEVEYVVVLSSVGAHLSEGAGVVQGLADTEQKFRELKSVNVIFLRPTYFMENLLGQVTIVKQAGILGSPLRPDLRFPIVATADIVRIATERLLARDWQGRQVQYILGARDVDNREIARVLGEAIGRPELPYVQISNDDFRGAMLGMGMSPSTVDAYVEFLDGMNSGRIMEDSRRTPESTTPTRLEDFAPAFAKAYEAA